MKDSLVKNMRRLDLKDKNGKPNLKKLFWYHGIQIKEFAKKYGMPYPKAQRILTEKELPDLYLRDIQTFAEALGYNSFDEFFNDAIEADSFKRTKKMDGYILEAIGEQDQYGVIMPSTIDHILKESNYYSKYNAVGEAKKPAILTEALTFANPDDLMIENGIDEFKISNGEPVYQVSHKDK